MYCKSLLLILFVSSIFFRANSQERKNIELPKYGKVLWELRTAKGWLNDGGTWISRNNRIPASIGGGFNKLQDYEKYSLGTDNFIYYQLREITIKDSLYCILIKFYKSGWYTYEAIEEDWNNDYGYCFYVFTYNEFKKILDVKPDTFSKIILQPVLSSESVWNNKPATVLNDILHDVANGGTPIASKFVFEVGNFPKKNIFQFQIYNCRGFGTEYYIGGITADDLDASMLGYFEDRLMKTCYFEAPYSYFSKLLSVVKTF